MVRIAAAALVLLTVAGTLPEARAGDGVWTSNGPYGGQVTVLAVDPKAPANLYAAGLSGVFRSTDGGASWARSSNGITDPSVASIAIDPVTPSTLYAGSLQGGHVVKSADGGASWTALPTGPTLVVAMAIPVQSPTTIYAAQQQSGVLKSTDGGATWTKVGVATLPSFPTMKSLVIDPANPNTIYAGEQSKGVFKSTDGGATWAAANTGFTTGTIIQVLKLAIDPSNPATLYAAANTSSGAGLYKSTNGGASWTQVYQDNSGIIIVQAIAVDPANSANVYIGTFSQGALKSTNGGASFAPINTGLPKVGVNVVALDPQSPAKLYAGTQNGVFASGDAGAGWTAASNGLALTTVKAVVVDPSTPTTVYAATTLSGLFKSVDGGDSWASINNGIGATGNLAFNMPTFTSLAIDPVSPGTLYAGTQGTSASQVYKSTNGGASWTAVATGLPGFGSVSALAIDPQAPSNIFAATISQGLYRSKDSGAQWSIVGSVPATAHGTGLAALRLKASSGAATVVALSTNGESLFLSTDGGDSFETPVTATSGATAKVLPCANGAEAVALSLLQSFEGIRVSVPCGSLGEMIAWHIAGLTGPKSVTLLPPTITPWGLPDGSSTQANACSPATSVVFDPRDEAAFYAGAACGVLRGTMEGTQLVTMSAGLPPGTNIEAVAVNASGSDVYAGAQASGVWRYTVGAAPATPVAVVEFYNASLDHYFITWVADEIAKLDAGTQIKGWVRTGQTFKTYTAAQAGTSPVCRYYIPPGLGDSHFFGRGTAECDATGQKNPSFVRESSDFMQMFLPAAGVCPANTVQVYRVFSNRPDANHRYMTDPALRTSMVTKGWLAEGDGPDLVVMCAPQ